MNFNKILFRFLYLIRNTVIFLFILFLFLFCVLIFKTIKNDKYQGYEAVLFETYGLEFESVNIISKNNMICSGVFCPREYEYKIEISSEDHKRLMKLLESDEVPGWRINQCGVVDECYGWNRSYDLREKYGVYVMATASIHKPIITISYVDI